MTGCWSSGWKSAVDGDYQKYSVEPGGYIREHFLRRRSEAGQDGRTPHRRTDPQAAPRRSRSREGLRGLQGGHRPTRVRRPWCWPRPSRATGSARPVKARTSRTQQKKLNESELREFRARFGIPISDEEVGEAPFYRPPDDSPETRYLRDRRAALGGSHPVAHRGGRTTRHSRRRRLRRIPRRFRARGLDDDGDRASCCRSCSRTRTSDPASFRSCPTRHAPSGWSRCSARSGSTRTWASDTSPSIVRRCFTTRRRPTARSSRKASRRPARSVRSSRRARPTRRTRSTWCRFSSSTRCSVSSVSVT